MSPQMNRNKLEIACIFYDILIVFSSLFNPPLFFYSLTLSLGQQMRSVLVTNQFRPIQWLSLGRWITRNVTHLGKTGESSADPSLAFLVCRPAQPSNPAYISGEPGQGVIYGVAL